MIARALTAPCNGCGAELAFKSVASVMAVCEFCGTTGVRDGQTVVNLGKMAELFDDHSPLTIGASGADGSQHFSIVGRLQYRDDQGVWSEWRLLYDDGVSGWLAEDNGKYTLSGEKMPMRVPEFADVPLGTVLAFSDTSYKATWTSRASVISAAGELPFLIKPGDPVSLIDMRSLDGQIASLDYSDHVQAAASTPNEVQSEAGNLAAPNASLYLGRAVTLTGLKMRGLNEENLNRISVESFSCPACGSAVTPMLADTLSISCGSCACVIDLSDGVGGSIAHFRQNPPPELVLPLGSTGSFENISWTIIGYQRRQGHTEEETFGWEEYLLYNRTDGFRFLTFDAGNWALSEILQQAISASQDRYERGIATYKNQRFDHFAQYTGSVSYVMGEFFWQVRQNDEVNLTDFIAPPQGLSREISGNEIVWSISQYQSRDTIAAAFNISPEQLPATRGLGMLAPAPTSQRPRYIKMLLAAVAVLVAVQALLFTLGSSQTLVEKTLATTHNSQTNQSIKPDTHTVTLTGTRPSNLVIETDSQIYNNDFGLAIELADPQGKILQSDRHLVSFYQGRSEGENWTEGSRDVRTVFMGLAPGQYRVNVTVADPSKQMEPVSYLIKQQGQPSWLPWLVGLALIFVVNIVAIWRESPPEKRRWAESEYGSQPGQAKLWHSSDDDDDD